MSKRLKVADRKTTCKFRFTVKCDEWGYFLELQQNSGQGLHNGHPRERRALSLPTRLLSEEQKNETLHVVNSASNKPAGRNYLFSKLGKFISNAKISYLAQKQYSPDTKKSDIEMMFDDFESSEEIAFTVLSDVPYSELDTEQLKNINYNNVTERVNNNQSITLCTTKSTDGKVINTPVSEIPLVKDIEPIAKEERKDRQMPLSDTLFISVAWVVLPAFRFFLLCPEVIWCDVTSHSNNKGFHLLTFSCRTSVDKQVIFLWIWIPNQQRFSFRWVFQHAIPILISSAHRSRVRFIMKDGDPQQRNEVIGSLMTVFTHAIEGGCGFHIVNMGWIRHVPAMSLINKSGQDRWKTIVRKIQGWLYSWMRPGYVEDDEEYQLSKYLLMMFIASAPVLSAAEGKLYMITGIMKFLNGYVFVYETLFLHYKRKHVRYFYTAHSSAHEVRSGRGIASLFFYFNSH